MGQKTGWRSKIPSFDTADSQGMGAFILLFLEGMAVKGFSVHTVDRYVYSLRYFVDWCALRGIVRPQDVTKPILERFQRYLFYYRMAGGAPLNSRTQNKYLSSVQTFFRFLAKNNYILSNPASDLELPRYGKRLPREILSISEMEQILNSIDIKDSLGFRDRAILETLYSTGIRRMELIHLKVFDIDVERQTLMVREGKGKKDRMIPIGERALAWIRKYLEEARASLVIEPDENVLFLTNMGEEFGPEYLSRLVKKHVKAAGIRKNGSCHMFRHSMATLMLEGGADIRYIQQMLGHSKLDTTSIYTQVSIRKLQEIYQATHPGAKLERKEPDSKALEDAESLLATEAELFSSLAAEGDEEDKK